MDLSVQVGFPKENNWDGCPKHMDVRFACRVDGILTLDVAGTHRQLCITDYKYRYAAGKNDFLIGSFIRHAHTHIW